MRPLACSWENTVLFKRAFVPVTSSNIIGMTLEEPNPVVVPSTTRNGSLEEDPEILLTKKKIKAMDENCQITLRRLTLAVITLAICLYCMFTCGYCLLLIMIFSACFCHCSSWLLFPFACSLILFIVSHIPTLEQAFTISEDIYSFHQKYYK